MFVFQLGSKFMTKSVLYVHKGPVQGPISKGFNDIASFDGLLKDYKWHYPDPFWVWRKAKVVLSSDDNV